MTAKSQGNVLFAFRGNLRMFIYVETEPLFIPSLYKAALKTLIDPRDENPIDANEMQTDCRARKPAPLNIEAKRDARSDLHSISAGIKGEM